MKISIYTRDSGFLWVETNPDGCTRIDDDYNAVIRADALNFKSSLYLKKSKKSL